MSSALKCIVINCRRRRAAPYQRCLPHAEANAVEEVRQIVSAIEVLRRMRNREPRLAAGRHSSNMEMLAEAIQAVTTDNCRQDPNPPGSSKACPSCHRPLLPLWECIECRHQWESRRGITCPKCGTDAEHEPAKLNVRCKPSWLRKGGKIRYLGCRNGSDDVFVVVKVGRASRSRPAWFMARRLDPAKGQEKAVVVNCTPESMRLWLECEGDG